MKILRRNYSTDIRSVFNLSNLFYFTKLKGIILKYNTMTRFESDVFDFVEATLGMDAAIKNYCFWSDVALRFRYMGYLATLPVKFVKLVWKNFKEKGVI